MFQITQAEQLMRNVAKERQKEVQMGLVGEHEEPGFSTNDVPVSVSVTPAYYWSVILIQSGQYSPAEGKLGWALSQLSPNSEQHKPHRRQLLLLLIPLRLRRGVLPSKEKILERYDGLTDLFGDLVTAVRTGDLA